MNDSGTGNRTSPDYWDKYWADVRVPIEIVRTRSVLGSSQADCILAAFDACLPRDRSFSALEIGGAPGQYLAFLKRAFRCDVAALDFSPLGCQKTRENFALLDLPIRVYQCDLFSPGPVTDRFDVVYSLGFIEHFDDLCGTVRQHLRFLKPGGTLILGVPSFLGINHWLMRRLSPGLLESHNLATMELASWEGFERELNLETLFRSYVGGFEPRMFWRCENRTVGNRCLHAIVRACAPVFRLRPFRAMNSRLFSGYAIGAYRVRS